MARGRHASKAGQSAFLRDATIMAVGIIIVAALMYGLLWLIQSWRSSDPCSRSPSRRWPPCGTTSTAALTLARSPRIYAWVEIVEDLSGAEVSDADCITAETTVPPTTLPPSTSTTAPTTTTTTAPTTTVPVIEVRPPEEVTVLVLNSVGTQGLAGRVTERLADLGYDMLEPDNFEPLLEQSRIWYKPGYGPDANDLAANFPDAVTEFNPDELPEADIVVLLGASYEEE